MNRTDILKTYQQHEAEILPIWKARGGTMEDAVTTWQADRHKGRKEIKAEVRSLYDQYRTLGLSHREAIKRIREDLDKRYAGNGRILSIVYWILKFALLFVFLF